VLASCCGSTPADAHRLAFISVHAVVAQLVIKHACQSRFAQPSTQTRACVGIAQSRRVYVYKRATRVAVRVEPHQLTKYVLPALLHQRIKLMNGGPTRGGHPANMIIKPLDSFAFLCNSCVVISGILLQIITITFTHYGLM